MGVYNGSGELSDSIGSILSQSHVNLEFVIVDDGSTDATGSMLSDYARADVRVRVFRQSNQGLTAALILGCTYARSEFIARQDVGDVSLPGRLSAQLEVLKNDRNVNVCSCHSEFVGPNNEVLYESRPDATDLQLGLSGPAHHGSVMMRRKDYERVGGYRRQFYFAQDRDLWSRLAEFGRHAVLPDVLYRAKLAPSAISGRYAPEQRKLSELITAATEARRQGKDETAFLELAERIRPIDKGGSLARLDAAGAYFIGCCLSHRDPVAAREYFREALRAHPLHAKAWLRLVQSHLLPGTMRRDQ